MQSLRADVRVVLVFLIKVCAYVGFFSSLYIYLSISCNLI